MNKVRKIVYWKGQTGDVYNFFDSCPVCQTEKSDHTLTKGQLQSPAILVNIWSEANTDFIMDLPLCGDTFDSVLVVIDKATRLTHLIGCSKAVTTGQIAKLYLMEVVRLHGIPKSICTNRGPLFVA